MELKSWSLSFYRSGHILGLLHRPVLSRVRTAAMDYSRIQNVTPADSRGVRQSELWAGAEAEGGRAW